MSDIALYIHIPFCMSKCLYCDFLSFAGKENYVKDYIAALLNEIKAFKTTSTVSTVFIGGGTPSVIDSSFIEEIMSCIYSSFNVSEEAEITIEANPGTVTLSKLTAYRKSGINRISFGVQAWQNRLLKSIGRIHTSNDIADSVKMAKMAGFDNINCDLMFSLPNQSSEDFIETINMVTALEPQHISAYSLIIEEGTPFFEMYEAGKISPVNDEEDRKMYHSGIRLLQEKGYYQYEISNFAKQGYECKHNLTYWYRGEYKGFGLGASSLINKKRLKNTEDFFEYINGKNHISVEELSLTDRQEEFMFLGLRCNRGISENEFYSAFGKDINSVYGSEINKLLKDKLIEKSNGKIYLTEKGFDLANIVFVEFMQ